MLYRSLMLTLFLLLTWPATDARAAGQVPDVTHTAPPLFVDLGPQVRVGDTVRFEFRIDGSTAFADDVVLHEAPALAKSTASPVPVVELLAARPARLEALRRAARERSVEVVISVGDSAFATYLLSDLERQSSRLAERQTLAPFGLLVTRTAAAPIRNTKSSCEARCDDEQDACYTYRCERFGAATCYDACDREWEECQLSCGTFCTPSTTSTTTTVITLFGPRSAKVCTLEQGSSRSAYQQLYDRRYKDTTTTTTTNGDCSQTVTTTVSYRWNFCWKWLNESCQPWVAPENPAATC